MSRGGDMVRFFTFSQFSNKKPVAGSTYLRVNQLIKYWPGGDLYKYGENPDVLILQKVYAGLDYKFPIRFEGIKILDLCDPDWMDGRNGIVETALACDAVTCSSKALTEFMSQIHDNVHFVPDRFDMELVPEPKKHEEEAKSVVWFGYSHNADLLRPALKTIREMDLHLYIISQEDPIIYRWGENMKGNYTFIKYNEDTIYKDLQKADYALLPDGTRPVDRYKSNNKTVKAILAGLPIARTPEHMKLYVNPNERIKFIDEFRDKFIDLYDCRKSVVQYKNIIDRIRRRSGHGKS